MAAKVLYSCSLVVMVDCQVAARKLSSLIFYSHRAQSTWKGILSRAEDVVIEYVCARLDGLYPSPAIENADELSMARRLELRALEVTTADKSTHFGPGIIALPGKTQERVVVGVCTGLCCRESVAVRLQSFAEPETSGSDACRYRPQGLKSGS
jgi:hypothetical protein